LLSPLVAAARQHDQHGAALNEVHPVSRSTIDAKLRYAVTNRARVTDEPALQPHNPLSDTLGSATVFQAIKPLAEFNGLPDFDLV
jgi:hypothetical protein